MQIYNLCLSEIVPNSLNKPEIAPYKEADLVWVPLEIQCTFSLNK